MSAIVGVEIGILGELEGAFPGMSFLGAIIATAALETVRRGPASPYAYLHQVDSRFG